MFHVKKTNVCNSPLTLRHLAFTLAEVLITIGIIGVVAAMTIPNLIRKNQEQNAVVQLKKTYTTLSNAFNRAVADNGAPIGWGLTSTTNYDPVIAVKMMGYLTPYMNVAKDCGSDGTIIGCFPDGTYKYRSGDYNSAWVSWININTNSGGQFARVRLADGSGLTTQYPEANVNCSYKFGTTPALQNVCGYIYVDIDGPKGQSQAGVDLFMFYLTNNGIVPAGTSQEINDGLTYFGKTFTGTCLNARGWGCTAWVIYNQNMDYNKCSTLDWSGSTSCP